MKKLLLLLLCLCLLLSACGVKTPAVQEPVQQPAETTQPPEKPETPEISEKPEKPEDLEMLHLLYSEQMLQEYDDSDFTLLCQMIYSGHIASAKTAEKYPLLAKTLKDMMQEESVAAQPYLQEMNQWALEQRSYRPDSFVYHTNEMRRFVQRADELLVSIRVDWYDYSGGVHPNHGVGCVNLDPTTGEEVDITHVMTDISGLPELLYTKLVEKYDSYEKENMLPLLKEYLPGDFTWTMDYDGMTFYFSPYEIASYAQGLMTVRLWFDEHPGLFFEEFTRQPKGSYAVEIPPRMEVEVDLDPTEEGRQVLFVWDELSGEMGAYVYLCIDHGGQTYGDPEFFGYDYRVYLVRTGTEKSWLYVTSTGDNDWPTLQVYSLNDYRIERVQKLEGVCFHGIWVDDIEGAMGQYGAYFEDVLTDPTEFAMETRLYYMGTLSGTKTYEVDRNGMAQTKDDAYDLREIPGELTAKIPLVLNVLPKETPTSIPAGTKAAYLATDGETYVDLLLDDGRQCRVPVTDGMINGLPEEECFDGIVYAG